MGWLLAIGVIILAIYSKAFRVIAFVVIVVAGLGIFAFTTRDNSRREAAKKLIPPTDIQIDDARLGNFAHFTARVRNTNASHALSSLDMTVTIRDCEPSGQCEVVGETTTSVSALVPPRQARDVEDYVFFHPSPHIRGRMEWSYVITAVSGEN